jgi:hypothetical protein
MNFKPSSLAQLFEPPDEHQGVFGWLCGYSADAGFLEDAVERFSGLTQAQRAHQGRVMLAVMLDPGNPQILPTEVPGVLHLPFKLPELPFLLLHAKVAILGFQCRDQFLMRAIVTTGNWTRQTLEESLDLAWHIDVANKVENKPMKIVRQERVDLAAVWSFLSWVRSLFDTRSLGLASGANNDSVAASEKVAAWASALSTRHRGYQPRFFHNRDSSLFQQLPDLIRFHARSVARNYLALGSGFYESVQSGTPDVPESIFALLRKERLLTAAGDRNIFVNPRACQAIATCRAWIEEGGWTIRAPRIPDYFGAAPRTLHAKFIFSANARAGSNNCASPWLYLGSGNLTNPGFKQRAGSTGNLEAGVVLAPTELKWEEDRYSEGASVVTNLLPIHRDDGENIPLPALQPGDDMPERGIAFMAAPIAVFLWRETPAGPNLAPQGEPTGPFCVLDPHGHPCERLEDGSFAWSAPRPRQVMVSWLFGGEDRTAHVPVIDHYGRFGAADFPSIDLEEAWIQLANFPMPPEDEELTGGDAQDGVDGVEATETSTQPNESTYPVRRMMTLVEDIAAKQANVAQADWGTWCSRLEQVLVQSKDSLVVKAFQNIGLNPLYPLLQPVFRPSFASTANTAEGARYESALQRVIEAWALEGHPALGGLS